MNSSVPTAELGPRRDNRRHPPLVAFSSSAAFSQMKIPRRRLLVPHEPSVQTWKCDNRPRRSFMPRRRHRQQRKQEGDLGEWDSHHVSSTTMRTCTVSCNLAKPAHNGGFRSSTAPGKTGNTKIHPVACNGSGLVVDTTIVGCPGDSLAVNGVSGCVPPRRGRATGRRHCLRPRYPGAIAAATPDRVRPIPGLRRTRRSAHASA